MWTLWIPFLFAALFGGGAVVALIWYLTSDKDRRPRLPVLLALPAGCVAVPIIAVVAFVGLGIDLRTSDTELYEEVFGYRPMIDEKRMIFDSFGEGSDREIFMRAEPTDAERGRLLAIPGLVPSDTTLSAVVAQGNRKSFTWWLSTEPHSFQYCRAARVREAPGFGGWAAFRIAQCTDAGSDAFAEGRTRYVYVVASRRGW